MRQDYFRMVACPEKLKLTSGSEFRCSLDMQNILLEKSFERYTEKHYLELSFDSELPVFERP